MASHTNKKLQPEAAKHLREILVNNKVFAVALLLIVIMSFLSERFLTTTNVFNILRQICITGIVASGFSLIIAAGEIDLSVGSIVAFVGIVTSYLMVTVKMPMVIAILAGLLVGMLCGMLNAVIISALDLPPFIVTLATQSLFRGVVYIWTNMVSIIGLPQEFVNIGQGYLGVIPIPVIIMVATFLIVWFATVKTSFGRHVIAMGGNKEAAYLCGVRISRVRLGIYGIVGLCCAVAAIVLTGRTASAQVSAGNGMEMDCITAVVIGGTPFTGGKVNIVGTFIGAFIVGIINNGLNLLAVDSNFQIIAKGLMILIALIIDRLSTNFLNKKRRKE